MADDNQDEQERLRLEEFQRQQAQAALEASRFQPNAIPADQVRAVDRTVGQTYAARGLPGPATAIAPTAGIGRQPTSEEQKNLGIGNFIDRFGDPISSTHDASGYPNPAPEHAVGVQGVVSPQEEQFWAANPMGAVPHPQTGELIGLGNNYASRQKAFDDITPPDQLAASRLPAPDFLKVPEIDPAIDARRQEIANEVAATQNELKGASTQRVRGQPSRYDVLTSKLNTLFHADSGLGLEQHRQAQEQSHAADQNRKLQEQYNIHRDASAASIALGRITANPGTDEYKKAIAKVALDYPYASQDPRVQEALLKASTFHDQRADLSARAKAAGLVEEITGYGQKGPSIKYVAPDEAARKAADIELKPYGVELQNIIKPSAVSVGRMEGDNFVNDSAGNIVSIGRGQKQNARVPIDIYLKHGGQLSAADQAAQINKTAAPTTPTAAAPTTHPQDNTALQWARANPKDPRAARILELNPQ